MGHRERRVPVSVMLRHAVRIGARHSAASLVPRVALPAVRRTFASESDQVVIWNKYWVNSSKVASDPATRPFPGASPSEPDMEYIEEPSMLYMTTLFAVPLAFSFWFCTKFV